MARDRARTIFRFSLVLVTCHLAGVRRGPALGRGGRGGRVRGLHHARGALPDRPRGARARACRRWCSCAASPGVFQAAPGMCVVVLGVRARARGRGSRTRRCAWSSAPAVGVRGLRGALRLAGAGAGARGAWRAASRRRRIGSGSPALPPPPSPDPATSPARGPRASGSVAWRADCRGSGTTCPATPRAAALATARPGDSCRGSSPTSRRRRLCAAAPRCSRRSWLCCCWPPRPPAPPPARSRPAQPTRATARLRPAAASDTPTRRAPAATGPGRAAAPIRRRWCPAGRRPWRSRGRGLPKLRQLDNAPPTSCSTGSRWTAPSPRRSRSTTAATTSTFRNGRIGNVTDEKGALVSGTELHVRQRRLPRRAGDRPVGPQRVRVRDRACRASPSATASSTTARRWTSSSPTAAGGRRCRPAYGNVTLENNVFGHTYKDDGTWHYYSLYVANTANGGGTLDGWTVRNNTFEIPANMEHGATGGSRWVGNLGDWNCVAGMRYSHNVGKKCAASDKTVSPAVSSAAAIAPLGWIDPGASDFRLRAGSPGHQRRGPERPPRPRPRRLRAGRPPRRRGPRVRGRASRERAGHPRRAARRRHPRPAPGRGSGGPPPAAGDLQAAAPPLPGQRAPHPRGQREGPRVDPDPAPAPGPQAAPRALAHARREEARTTRIRAHGLARGRYRVVVVATSRRGQALGRQGAHAPRSLT